MERARTQPTLHIVKQYESLLEEGEKLRIVMYRKGRRYGVAMYRGEIVSTINSSGEISKIVTYEGNEANIIEWVKLEKANEHYLLLLKPLFGQSQPARVPGSPPILTVVI